MNRFAFVLVLFATIGLAHGAPPYRPYKQSGPDAVYHLLFCDDLAAFAPKPGAPSHPWELLAAKAPDLDKLAALAEDDKEEGRVRSLAYARLRQLGQAVSRRVLLGVIAEVGLPGGLDTLAAFSDGGVRYINQSGKMVVVEGKTGATTEAVQDLLNAGQIAIGRLSPFNEPRLPPPQNGAVRFTFLTSDGLYVIDGLMSDIERDRVGRPILSPATELLKVIIKMGSK